MENIKFRNHFGDDSSNLRVSTYKVDGIDEDKRREREERTRELIDNLAEKVGMIKDELGVYGKIRIINFKK